MPIMSPTSSCFLVSFAFKPQLLSQLASLQFLMVQIPIQYKMCWCFPYALLSWCFQDPCSLNHSKCLRSCFAKAYFRG